MTNGAPRKRLPVWLSNGRSAWWKRPTPLRILQTLALFGLWVALSGHFEIEFLMLGAITAVGTTAFTTMLFRGTHEGRYKPMPSSILWLVRSAGRFLLYVPWLAWEIMLSNAHVVYLVLHPKMPIYPTLIEFDTCLESEYARVLLAQSMTVTPGTVTIDATNKKLLVHCLSHKSREGVAQGDIQNKVAWVFEEPRAERVEIRDIRRPEQVPV